MPDKRATLRQDTVRNDIAKALNGRQPQIAAPSASALLARKNLAGQIARQNLAKQQGPVFTPLGQSAKGSLWRGPDKPIDPLMARKRFRPI